MPNKIINFDTFMLSTDEHRAFKRETVFTNDENSVEINFNVKDIEDLTPFTPHVLLFMRDGSFYQITDQLLITKAGTTVKYTLQGNEGKHAGIARTQLMLISGEPQLASAKFEFNIENGLDTVVATEVMIQDWSTLLKEARDYIDLFVANEAARQTTFETNEAARQAIYDDLFETGVLQSRINEKLVALETEYAPKLTEVTAQLAQTSKRVSGVVSVREFGAKGDGVTDDTLAIQNAFDYALENKVNIVMDGVYIVKPSLMPDGSKVCVYLVDNSPGQNYELNIEINFRRGAMLKTLSTEECTLLRFKAGNVTMVNPVLRAGNTVTLLELSRFNKLDVSESDFITLNTFRNMKLVGGKIGVSMEGQAFYNTFDTLTTQSASDTAILLKESEYQKVHNVKESNVNRNNFNDVSILGGKNGVAIYYGNTNKFNNVSFEGLSGTAINVDSSISQQDNSKWTTDDNMFVNITTEAVNKVFRNNALGTKIINTSAKFVNADYLILPQTYLGGINGAYSVEKSGNYIKIPDDNNVAILPYTGMTRHSDFFMSGFGIGATNYQDIKIDNVSKSVTRFQKQLIPFDLGLCVNVTDILYDGTNQAYKPVFKRIGGIVYVEARLKITVSDVNAIVRLPIPEKFTHWENFGSTGNLDAQAEALVVNTAGLMKMATMQTTRNQFVIRPPESGWSPNAFGNTVFLKTFFFADGVVEI